jgi:hypothetical protein
MGLLGRVNIPNDAQDFTGGTTLDFYNFLVRGVYSFRDGKLSNKPNHMVIGLL